MAASYNDLTFYGESPFRFQYDTADDVDTVTGSGYFNSISNALRTGDILYVTASDGNLIAFVVVNRPSTVIFALMATVDTFNV